MELKERKREKTDSAQGASASVYHCPSDVV